ncbi:MAG TPA: tRNA pseudouridine(55) synthase TruB [Candidatus Binataceae bacterium]|nr:tRNA pseudouridine(55) synthase TruB [Candidatus Binataceae bacterium]
MNAIVLVDKPAGITSAEVVRRIKALVKPARVGHLGTLDPFATGLLPIMIGEATKLAPFIESGDKEYEGTIRLGVETDTLDREGEEVATAAIPQIEQARLDEVAAQFTGEVQQVPPVFSAIKREGVPLYKRARRGEEVEPPPPRTVTIKSLELELAGDDSITFRLVCGTGTYARSLARDVAIALGTVGHLCSLRRTRNGIFSIEDASPVDVIVAAMREGSNPKSVSLCEALAEMPAVRIDAVLENRLRNGDSRALDTLVPPEGVPFRLVDAQGELVAVARPTSRVTAVIERIFNV